MPSYPEREDWEGRRRFDLDWQRRLYDAGYAGIDWPAEYGGQEIPFEGTEDVPVDLWTYDFGPNRLMRRVRFIAGKVDSVDTLEHGKAR